MTQSSGHFQSFFWLFSELLFVPPTLNLKKKSVNQLIKNLALLCFALVPHDLNMLSLTK